VNYWTPVADDDGIYVALIEPDGRVLRRHPIEFDTDREALRAAARLNARDTAEECPATMVVEKMAGLPLDCVLERGHDGPHVDSVTDARWVP
jgi:hypothetical protein